MKAKTIKDNIKSLKTKRSIEEIKEKISELCADDENFTTDNYGTRAHLDGNFEVRYSEYFTTKTMNDFVKWLFDNETF